MTEVERYLRLATWGLWGTRKQEVRDELEEHILERAHHLQIFGVPPHEAVHQAIRELGPPERIGIAMNGVYHMPNIIKTTALATLLTTVGLSSITSSGAQVAATNSGPNFTVCAKSSQHPITTSSSLEVVSQRGNLYCYRPTNPRPGLWAELHSLARVLREQGVQIHQDPQGIRLTFPDAQRTVGLAPGFRRGNQWYKPAVEVLHVLGSTGLPVRVEGWENPTVHVGRTSFALGAGNATINAAALYESIGVNVARTLLNAGGISTPGRGHGEINQDFWKTHLLRTSAKPGQIVALVTRQPSGTPTVDVAPVESDGTVRLYASHDKLNFVRDPSLLTPYLSKGRAQALLIELTGALPLGSTNTAAAQKIIQPQAPTSNALP